MVMSGQLHALVALTLEKESSVVNKKLHKSDGQSGHSGENKNPCACQELNPACTLLNA